jgi:hypothetical protein
LGFINVHIKEEKEEKALMIQVPVWEKFCHQNNPVRMLPLTGKRTVARHRQADFRNSPSKNKIRQNDRKIRGKKYIFTFCA